MRNDYEFIKTEFENLYVIKPLLISDNRGVIKKSFEKSIFRENSIIFEVVEEMETTSKKNVIRGLHFQSESSQAKLIRCMRGSILDVVVDLRRDSKMFGKSFSIHLSENNKDMLYVPRGFAHGCKSMEDNTTIYYLADNRYYPKFDSGIIWNDGDLNIDWEVISEDEVILSEKDLALQTFKEYKESNGIK